MLIVYKTVCIMLYIYMIVYLLHSVPKTVRPTCKVAFDFDQIPRGSIPVGILRVDWDRDFKHLVGSAKTRATFGLLDFS